MQKEKQMKHIYDGRLLVAFLGKFEEEFYNGLKCVMEPE
jgi:hypothetical protein